MIDKNLQAKILSSAQFTTKDIIEIFSYDAGEKLKRFALAGLFLKYRACNHSGQLNEHRKS